MNSSPTALFTAKIHLTQQAVSALGDAAELVLQIGHAAVGADRLGTDAWAGVVPRERIRLALPLIVRDGERAALEARLRALAAAGWRRWECADLAGLDLLRSCVPDAEDVTADGSFQALNRAADGFLRAQGITRRVTSPEDTLDNLTACSSGGPVEALVFQITPLFIAQTPPCVGSGGAPAGPVAFAGRHGQTLHSLPLDGRWITTDERPFCCADAIPDLLRLGIRRFRCDWSWRPSEPRAIAAAWQAVCRGETPAGSHPAHFRRGLQ